jgi:cobalt-zinc-cadmium efflux system outer membrane protein
MLLRLAALAALVVVPYAHAGTEPASVVLSLDDAMARTLATHPELRLFDAGEAVLAAEAQRAGQAPPLAIDAQLENAAGTGQAAGVRAAELTVSLASVIERGGKRAARRHVVASRGEALRSEKQAKRLDLLAEVARRYLDLVAARAHADIAAADLLQRQRTVEAAIRRVRAGASPEAVQFAAEALRSRAELALERSGYEREAAWRRLAVLWNERGATAPPEVRGMPFVLPALADFQVLAARLRDMPDLQRFAVQARIREARLQLARTARTPDLTWQLGVRRLQQGSDWGVVAGVSIPLGNAARATPDIRVAEVELGAIELEREAGELSLYATLAQAYGQYAMGKSQVERARDDLLPRLRRAEASAERAYRAGALSYLDWAQLQNETTAAREQQLAAALDAQRALIEIQRLTGEAIVAVPSSEGTTP